ncbi:MAG: hypothetical protein AAFO62_08560, partial [Pseudomonadota bacterium]
MDELIKIGAAVFGLFVMVVIMMHTGGGEVKADAVAEFRLNEREAIFYDACFEMKTRLRKTLRVMKAGQPVPVSQVRGCGCLAREVGRRIGAASFAPAAAVLDLAAARRSVHFNGPTVQDRIYTTVDNAVARYRVTHEGYAAAEEPVARALEVCTRPNRYEASASPKA